MEPRDVLISNLKTLLIQLLPRNLLCDNDWVPSTITSLQMAGVFVGNVACGHVADLVGRKPPFFLAFLTLIISNIIAAFSTSRIMFAVIRFFIGLEMGFQLTVQYNIVSEFTLAKWRTWVVAVPSWAIEVTLFALVSWLVNDWQHLHFVTEAIGVPFLAAYWFVPESFRWYVGHDRIRNAENVIKSVAKVNGKPPPDLSTISQMDPSITPQQKDRKYSLFDVLKNKDLRKYTFLLAFVWYDLLYCLGKVTVITLGLAVYGIQFGVSALSGNIYINMFVIGLIGSPVQLINIPLQNRLVRKKTAILFFVICAVFAIVVAVTQYFTGKDCATYVKRFSGFRLAISYLKRFYIVVCFKTKVRDQLSNVAAIVSLTAINACWSPIQTLTIEIYPTVVRNIGYGLQNTMARVGAIIGPQLVFLDTKVAGMMYWICGVTAVISIFVLLPIPETRGVDLTDKLSKTDRVKSGEAAMGKTVETEEICKEPFSISTKL
ncbi:organic cation/carnitine transporter 2-like [Mercenaria mercenaria]|uniref:organic cation/carnitine transporter 2-like n=1 Tax=Mercenaria mercenaria TaxID=6596 RepID=UPI00234ED7A4|nr:organic cation/carnitine transporter 2-like [Mercenaria mercenaria]